MININGVTFHVIRSASGILVADQAVNGQQRLTHSTSTYMMNVGLTSRHEWRWDWHRHQHMEREVQTEQKAFGVRHLKVSEMYWIQVGKGVLKYLLTIQHLWYLSKVTDCQVGQRSLIASANSNSGGVKTSCGALAICVWQASESDDLVYYPFFAGNDCYPTLT